MDTRVEDFLNDKVQAYADFESLDLLLAELSDQHEKLRDQLQSAEIDRQSLISGKDTSLRDIEKHVKEYTASQNSITHRISSLAGASAPSTATASLLPAVETERSLQVATGYIQTLLQFNDFSQQIGHVQNPVAVANAAFSLLTDIKSRHEKTDEAAPHLVDCIERVTRSTRKSVEDELHQALTKLSTKFLWPKPDIVLTEAIAMELEQVVHKLLALQCPEIEAAELTTRPNELYRPVVLTPFKILMEPLALRFSYHFTGSKSTNRIDKPQYFLSHAIEILNTYAGFFGTHLQPILVRQFSGTPLASAASYIDSTTALVNAIMPLIEAKLDEIMPACASDPRLLSHLIHELIQFDIVLRNEWRYDVIPSDPSSESIRWHGVADALLSDSSLFQQWLNAEKELAVARYEDIVGDPNASSLDLDAADANCTRPTKAAVRIQDLVAGITYHFRDLYSLSMRLRFLIDIQIVILDRFFSRLESSLEAYIALTSALGRVMQGNASQENDVRGVKGLEHVVRVCGSAEYFEKSMQSWSDEPFFLELWDDLQARARNGETIGKNLDVSEVARQTSSSLVQERDGTDIEMGAVFDESAAAYRSLKVRAESLITTAICTNASEALSVYLRSTASWSMSTTEDAPESVTAELSHCLRVTASELTFIVRVMSRTTARRILRAWSGLVEKTFLDSVIYKYRFTLRGAQQLRIDVDAIENVATNSAAQFGLVFSRSPKLKDALSLLTMDTTSSSTTDVETMQTFDQMLFADGKQARQALDDWDLGSINPQEARKIMSARAQKLSTS